MTFLYLIQFLLLPTFFRSTDNETWFAFFLIMASYFIFAFIYLSDQLFYWLISDIIYIILIFLYHPAGVYGIGMRGLNLGVQAQAYYNRADAWFGIIILLLFVITIQILVWGGIKLAKKYYY